MYYYTYYSSNYYSYSGYSPYYSYSDYSGYSYSGYSYSDYSSYSYYSYYYYSYYTDYSYSGYRCVGSDSYYGICNEYAINENFYGGGGYSDIEVPSSTGCVSDMTSRDTAGDDCTWYDARPGKYCHGRWWDDSDFSVAD